MSNLHPLFQNIVERHKRAASAIEAQRAETAKTGSVEDESAGPKDDAQNMSGPSHE